MKVTIELTDNIIWALSAEMAEACYDGWYNGITDDSIPTKTDKILLYKHAFRDGMDYMLSLIEGKEDNHG